MPSKNAVYWDSCVFLDRLKRKPERIAILEAITDAAASGDFIIVTSSVTLAEVIKVPELGTTLPEQVTTIQAFFENPWLSVRIVDEVIARSAAEIRRSSGLKTCDSIHIATAIRYGVPILQTYDGLNEDGSIKEGKFLLAFDEVFGEDPKLKIKVPSNPRPSPPTPSPGLFGEQNRLLNLD